MLGILIFLRGKIRLRMSITLPCEIAKLFTISLLFKFCNSIEINKEKIIIFLASVVL